MIKRIVPLLLGLLLATPGSAQTIGQGSATWYATLASSSQVSPYQDILALGDHTLSPVTHYDPTHCGLPGWDGTHYFCGDEVAFGPYTLMSDVYGRDNTAIGDHALANNISGMSSTAVGSSAAANANSDEVDAFGVAACQNGVAFTGPMGCFGQASLENAQSPSGYDLAVGFQAALMATNATHSTVVGVQAGSLAQTITNSILLGQGAGQGVQPSAGSGGAITNSIMIGTTSGPNLAAGQSVSNQFWLGGTPLTNGGTPLLYGDLAGNGLGIGTTTLIIGAALSVGATSDGKDVEIQAGGGYRINGDTGFNRYNPAAANFGTGATDDHTGTIALTNILAFGYLRTGLVAYASLGTTDPTPQVGDRLAISDASACTANTAVTAGGGSAHSCPVIYNGAAWIAEVTH
jgi:hypothetical protein